MQLIPHPAQLSYMSSCPAGLADRLLDELCAIYAVTPQKLESTINYGLMQVPKGIPQSEQESKNQKRSDLLQKQTKQKILMAAVAQVIR